MSTLGAAIWSTVDDLEPTTNKLHHQISQVLKTANFERLEDAAVLARGAEFANVGSATISTDAFTFGMNNVVFKIAFSDGVIWIARICHASVLDNENAKAERKSMLSEIATLRTLRQRTMIPVPDVFAFEASASNAFGFPYILMDYLKGKTTGATMAGHVPAKHSPHVSKQLAEVLSQLQNLSFDKLGRIWCGERCDGPPEIIPNEDTEAAPAASLEWFYRHRQDQNRKALEAHVQEPEWRTACWVLKSAMAQIIVQDRVHGPFLLCHFDLHYGNLLFDDEYNLTGVLDWSGAGTAPLERLAVSPEWITFPGITDEQNQVILDFREAVRDHLRHLEAQSPHLAPAGSKTMLLAILGTRRSDITHRCTYSFPHRALWDGRLVAKLLYQDAVSWEQLVAAHGGSQVY
ncbi:Protein kinase-like domain [Cordyceps militaris CM01]|uniref:Protein kinase-like domain n=1 Tax=Cordyceps militaris (strain CM01) TaxID=983644 RepID=G3J8I9_CORMM|nr:Protein kinase-like domain [Cordyceps militaris CM01]EGX94776.1 Protein kinase-like domain [Cordyceps militaris CM01]